MMDLGSGIALGSLCVGASAVAITAIRVRSSSNGKPSLNGKPCFPCPDHSGVVECLKSFQKTSDRQEKWLGTISEDVKKLLTETRHERSL